MNVCVACLLYFSHSIGCLFIHSFISFSFFLSIIHFLYVFLSFLPLLQSIIFDHYPQGASSAGWTTKKQFVSVMGFLTCTGTLMDVLTLSLLLMLKKAVHTKKISHPEQGLNLGTLVPQTSAITTPCAPCFT